MAGLKPTWRVAAIYDVTPKQLEAHHIKAVLTDLDNTLIAWNNPDGTPILRQWLAGMKEAGIPVVVVSNNNHRRIQKAVAALGLPFVARALKPLPKGINRAVKNLGLPKSAVVMVGDQLFTDVLGGNLAGVRTILVAPLVATDAWNTRINRFFEKIAFKLMGQRAQREDLNGK